MLRCFSTSIPSGVGHVTVPRHSAAALLAGFSVPKHPDSPSFRLRFPGFVFEKGAPSLLLQVFNALHRQRTLVVVCSSSDLQLLRVPVMPSIHLI